MKLYCGTLALSIFFGYFGMANTAHGGKVYKIRNGNCSESSECSAAASDKTSYFGQHELCESEIVNAEKKYGIPHRLLMAIGTVESGRSAGKTKGRRPWPWTICAAGKSFYCSTKSAAIATVKRLMARGLRNIDVGCMQVNLMHHSKAFKDLEEAFTPRNNVDYAAKFFTRLKQNNKTWTKAVGYYHSAIPTYYKPYCEMVYNTWKQVQNHCVRSTPQIQQAASKLRSNVSFLPEYYSLMDRKTTEKLHKLGRQSINHKPPRFLSRKK